MATELNIWDKLTRVVVFLLFLAGALAIAIWYLPLIEQNQRMRKEILRLDAQIQKKEDEQKHYRAMIDALQHDPKAVERVARERFGFAKPGETVICFEANNTATASRHR